MLDFLSDNLSQQGRLRTVSDFDFRERPGQTRVAFEDDDPSQVVRPTSWMGPAGGGATSDEK